MAAALYVDVDYWAAGYEQTGVSIDWDDRVIFVPRSFMPVVQTVPTEIRQLSLTDLHESLRDLEDDTDGIMFPVTHNYISPITVGGVTLALIVEIINNYMMTFEDGAYAVNVAGGNSNVGDRAMVNRVSVRSANSAGLVQVATGSGLSVAEQAKLDELHKIHGLASGTPLVVTPTGRDAGAGVSQSISEVAGTVTVTRL